MSEDRKKHLEECGARMKAEQEALNLHMTAAELEFWKSVYAAAVPGQSAIAAEEYKRLGCSTSGISGSISQGCRIVATTAVMILREVTGTQKTS